MALIWFTKDYNFYCNYDNNSKLKEWTLSYDIIDLTDEELREIQNCSRDKVNGILENIFINQ